MNKINFKRACEINDRIKKIEGELQHLKELDAIRMECRSYTISKITTTNRIFTDIKDAFESELNAELAKLRLEFKTL